MKYKREVLPLDQRLEQVQDKILQDYYQFFTDPNGIDMLPYAYMGSSSTYDLMVKNNPDYYLFNEEVAIIKNHNEKFTDYLSGVEDIIEIGPGSNYTITHKTIPLLNYGKSLKCYYAIDHSKPYLDNACNFLRTNTNNIEIIGIEADLMSLGSLKTIQKQAYKKCILFLGSTIGNFSQQQQLQALQQIFQLMNHDDQFILAVDTNQDEESLIKAYDNLYSDKLIIGVLEYFAIINPIFADYLKYFKVKCLWNQKTNTIERYFKVTQDTIFEIKNYGKIFLRKNQELRGVISRKSAITNINDLLYKIGFNILDILNHHSKAQLIICKKPKILPFGLIS